MRPPQVISAFPSLIHSIEVDNFKKTQDELINAKPDDMIIVSDLDEIPNLEKVDLRTISQKLIFLNKKCFTTN